MKIKYFAWLKNFTHTDSEEIIDNNIVDINSLKKYLCNKYPKLNEYIIKEDIVRIAVNLEYISNNCKLSANDEIAFFPPVSGG
jgi:molybdopterin synthase sulfur carrier subunit